MLKTCQTCRNNCDEFIFNEYKKLRKFGSLQMAKSFLYFALYWRCPYMKNYLDNIFSELKNIRWEMINLTDVLDFSQIIMLTSLIRK